MSRPYANVKLSEGFQWKTYLLSYALSLAALFAKHKACAGDGHCSQVLRRELSSLRSLASTTKYLYLHCPRDVCGCSVRKTSKPRRKWNVCNWILPQQSCWRHLAQQQLINKGASITPIIASIIRMFLLREVLMCCLSCRQGTICSQKTAHSSSLPQQESLISDFSCPCLSFGEQ